MQFEIANKKLEREQEKRLQDAKRKREKELRLAAEQLQREEAMAMLAAVKKEEQERADALRLQQEQEELALTGGIQFYHALKPYPIDGDDDKVILPEECLTELNTQDAFGRGAIYFRLVNNNNSNGITGKVTHCGVREFTAPPNCMSLHVC
jgi:hypothetical protein